MSHTAIPSGPKGDIFGLSNTIAFQRDPLGFLTRTAHDYDDIIHWKFGPYNTYMIKHPDYIHDVLLTHADKLTKWDRFMAPWFKAFGNASFNTEGELWRRQRRLSQPAFHSQRVKNYATLIVEHTERMLTRWQDQQEYEMNHEMSDTTMGIISEILFGIKDVQKDAAELHEALTVESEMIYLEASSLIPVPDWVPTPRNLRENRAIKTADDFVLKIVESHRASGIDHGDMASALLSAVDTEEVGGMMTDRQVCDELKGLFAAGHETTSQALTWTLYLLAEHPEIQQKLYEHVSGILGDRSPTLDDITTMTYTDKVLREGMRMYPPVWMLQIRETTEDIQVGNTTIPKGGLIFICPWVMHHDPRYFPEPQHFDPERFDRDWKKRIPTYAYFPFGGGMHVCTGSHLAMLEAEIMLAMMIQRYRFELVPGQTIEPQAFVTIRPKNGLHLKIHKR